LKLRIACALSLRESGLDDHAQTQDTENEAADSPKDRADQGDGSSEEGTEGCPDRSFSNRTAERNSAQERPRCDWGEHDSDAGAEHRTNWKEERNGSSGRMGIPRENERCHSDPAEDGANDDAGKSKASRQRDDSARSGDVHA